MLSSPPPAPMLSSPPPAPMLSSPPPAPEPKHPSMPSSPPPAPEPKHPSSDETSDRATPSAVEKPPSSEEEMLSTEKINGGLFDPTVLDGATPSAVEKPPSSEKISSKKASSGKPFAWIGDRLCLYFLGVPDSHGGVLFVVLVSMLYALVTPCLLRRVAGQPTGFVWTVSILACSFFLIGAIRLSVTMSFQAVFFRISYVALLSVSALHFIGCNSGAAVGTLLTFYAAGIFGYCIADYVQRAESEGVFIREEDQKQQSGRKVDGNQQFDQKQSGRKEDEKQQFKDEKQQFECKEGQNGCKKDQKRHGEPLICFLFVHGILSLFVLVRMVWVILRPESVTFIAANDDNANVALLIVEEFSLETIFVVWPWACLVAVILQEGIVVSMNTMVYKVPTCFALSYALSTVLSIALGEAYALLALWPAPMAMVALVGYLHAMFARYDHIHASLSQDQQPMLQKGKKIPCIRCANF